MENNVQLVLLLTSSILLFTLGFKLLRWSIKFKRFEDDKNNQKEILSNNKTFEQSFINQRFPSTCFININNENNDKKVSLIDITEGKHTIFAFLDSECIYCHNYFETFFQDVKQNNTVNYVVVMKDSQINEAKSLLELYSNKITIVLDYQQLYKELKLTFMPAFIHVDKNLIIRNATPLPRHILNLVFNGLLSDNIKNKGGEILEYES